MQICAFCPFKDKNNLVICKGLTGTAERARTTGPGALLPFDGHKEHNDNAVGVMEGDRLGEVDPLGWGGLMQ